MREIVAVFVLFSMARADGIGQVTNSAPVGTMLVHADISPVAGLAGGSITARLFFSTDNQQTWTERTMSRMAEPGYDSTWQAVIELPPGPGPVWYYVNVNDGNRFYSQSPVNTANTWPVTDSYLARIATDPVGDMIPGSDGAWLDLTGARVGRSNDRFYVELTNNHNSWPTSGGILKWYAYSFAFISPEAPCDSWAFAAIHVSVPLVAQSGLYFGNRHIRDNPERIGDIDLTTSGNRLMMRFRIEDMISHPRFGPWPNSQGWLYGAAGTHTITASGDIINDTTAIGLFDVLRTQRPSGGSNRPFRLSAPRVVPDTGTPGTEFSFSVSYTDPDSNPPTVRQVEAGGRTLILAPDNRRYWRGTTFRAGASGFAPGNHTASFILSDGAAAETTRVSFYVSGGSAVGEETGYAELSSLPRLPTVARGSLYLPASNFYRYSLLSSTGRQVAELRVGSNDISRLTAGVYFVRVNRAGANRKPIPATRHINRLLILN